MKRLLSLFLLSISAVAMAFSQNFTLQGRVADAENAKEGLPQATAILLKNDTVMVAGASSDAGGYFSLEVKSAGK